MKNCLKLTFFLLFSFKVNLISQELSGRITYNVSYNVTIEQVTKRNKAIGRKISKRSIDKIKNAKDVLAFLEFNSTYAIQKIEAELKNDAYKGINSTRMGAGNNKVYFTENSFEQKNSILECRTLGECFLIEQPKSVWEISQESKIIGGYLCYRAIYKTPLYTSTKPIAWFTPKISASYGPKFFSGLPGLILELEDNTVTFKAIKIELNPKEKIEIKKPKGKKITKEAYEKLLRKTFPGFYKRWEKYKSSNNVTND